MWSRYVQTQTLSRFSTRQRLKWPLPGGFPSAILVALGTALAKTLHVSRPTNPIRSPPYLPSGSAHSQVPAGYSRVRESQKFLPQSLGQQQLLHIIHSL